MYGFLEGDVPIEERVAYDEHLESCSRCSLLMEEARGLRELEGELGSIGTEDGDRPNQVGSNAWIRRLARSLDDSSLGDESTESLEDYDDVAEIRRGGQGIIYHAVQKSTGRRVAIKALRGGPLSDARTRARFDREVQILGQLDNEDGICPIIDCFERDGETFLVMPFVEGETLSKRLARAAELHRSGATPQAAWAAIAHSERSGDSAGKTSSQVTPRTASQHHRGSLHSVLRMIERVAHCVHAFHERGIVHRDLTPGNVMLRPDGKPVVLDFGLALDVSGSEAGRLTQEGELLGTPVYMAPEQADGRGSEADPRTDVYSLGAILYELLAFRPPYEGPRTKVILQRVLRGVVTMPRKLNPAIPKDLEAVCLKAMDPEPSRRYSSAFALAEDLAHVRALEPTEAKPRSIGTRLLLRARRNPAAAAGIVIALSMAALAFYFRAEGRRGFGSAVHAGQVLVEALDAGALSDEGLETLKELGLEPDAARQLDASYCRELLEELGDRRAGDDAEVRIVSPRSATTILRPSFDFALAASASRAERIVRLELENEGTVLARQRVAPVPNEEGLVEVELPVTLEPGTRYLWSVCDRNGAPEAVRSFRVVDPALVEARLAALKSSEDPAVDVLLRAATLLSLGLATPALELLDRFPEHAASTLHRQRRVLEAVGFLLLEEGHNARKRLALAGVLSSEHGGG